MRFNFTGNLKYNGLDSDKPFVSEGTTKSGNKYIRLNMSIAAATNNRAFIECFGMQNDEIKTSDIDGNQITIDWSDRFDEDVIKQVANYRKHVVTIGSERKEFITDYDFIEYIRDNIEDIASGKVTVTGNVNKNVYKGKISDRFTINNIYTVDDEKKNSMKVNGIYFWNKDSVDTADFKSEKKIYIDGYTYEYVSKDEGSKYFPMQTIFDCSKLDFENEKHINLLKFKLMSLGMALDGDKVKCTIKGNKYVKHSLELAYINGAEQLEFTEEMLTPYQKELVDLGIKTLDELRPAGSAFGDSVTLYKIVNFDARGDYENGFVEIKDNDDIDDNIFVIPEEETLEEAVAKSKKEDKVEEVVSDDDEDLFA